LSEEQQVDKTKLKLPTKTRIAVWWLIIVGLALTLLAIVYMFALFLQCLWSSPSNSGLTYVMMLFGGAFTLISGILPLKRNKLAWKFSVGVLVIAMICSIGGYLYLSMDPGGFSKTLIIILAGLIIYLAPLILIILDRKNYSEMLRQREKEL